MKCNQNGMSLVETLVALGIAGVIGVVLMRQQETAIKMQTKNDINQVVNSAAQVIQTSLSNSAICSKSLEGKGPGETIPFLVDAVPNPAYTGTGPNKYIIKTPLLKHVTAGQLLPGNVVVESMTIITDATTGKDYLKVMFDVDPDNRKKKFGSNKFAKLFQVHGEKVSGKYQNCNSEDSNIQASAVKEACMSLGASWDSINNKCKLTHLPNCIISNDVCGGVFSHNRGEWNLKVYNFNGRTCTVDYDRHCMIGGGDFTRSCTCATKGCTCTDSMDDVTCYTKKNYRCSDNAYTESMEAVNRCCQTPNLPFFPPFFGP